MYSIPISAQSLGFVVWRYFLASNEYELRSSIDVIANAMTECEITRVLMDKKTGSISLASSVLLHSVIRSLKPRSIFELGTFIGNSTVSMALALDLNGSGKIYTCDGSNSFHLPTIAKAPIHPYPHTNSIDALKDVMKREKSIDLFFLDGRIQKDDARLISQLSHNFTTIVFDDFEGMEKGVSNLMVLRATSAFDEHVLIHPPSQELLAEFGLHSMAPTAMLVPKTALRFTAQDSEFSN